VAVIIALTARAAFPADVSAENAILSADTIFSRARMALSRGVCPTRIDSMISVEATIAGRRERNRFRAHDLVDDDVLSVSALSDEEIRNPATPHGANIRVSIPFGGTLYGPKRRYEDTEIVFTIEPTTRFPVFRIAMPSWYDVLKEPDR